MRRTVFSSLGLETEVLITKTPILNLGSCLALLTTSVSSVSEKEIGYWARDTSTMVNKETR